MCKNSCNNGLLRGTKGAENVIGHYAVSLAGHDSGKIYLVVGKTAAEGKGEQLLLADGSTRPVAKPKAKKTKHAVILKERDEVLASLLSSGRLPDDSVLIRSIKLFKASRNSDND